MYVADSNFGAGVRFIANKFWFSFSKSGDVRIYSKKELGDLNMVLAPCNKGGNLRKGIL